jgi:hypothetical protein
MIVSRETILKANIQVDSQKLRNIPITIQEFHGIPGREHYKLLSYLATTISNSTIIDIGTYTGASALALSVNLTNTVYSFDTICKTQLLNIPNAKFKIADLWDSATRETWSSIILGSPLIVLDVDPHSGNPEYEFYQWLKQNNYRGLLFCDDIHYFKDMRDNFWYKIPSSEKIDITAIGHWSGAGIISFVPRPDLVWETYSGMHSVGALIPPSPWTVVTAYFDLSRMSDASAPIKERDRKHYLNHARTTMCLDQNLIVFCEKDNVDDLKAMRPSWLLEKTKFYVVDFEELPMTKYRQKIIDDRIRRSYNPDPRNTASYYLMCMSRYAVVKMAMEDNPFNSTHFAWLNICIERMGFNNIVHLDEVFSGIPRDKFSTAYIDYLSKEFIDDLPVYFQWGRCTMCSGFFTGRKDYFTQVCNLVEQQFLEYLKAGYGHADEQLFSPVYFKNPELFEHYFGDYQQMITNYRYTYENPGVTLQLVIPRSAAAKDWTTCRNACNFLRASHARGTITLSDSDLKFCNDVYNASRRMYSSSSEITCEFEFKSLD